MIRPSIKLLIKASSRIIKNLKPAIFIFGLAGICGFCPSAAIAKLDTTGAESKIQVVATMEAAIDALYESDFQSAHRLLEQELLANPNNERAHHYLGRVEYLKGNFEQSEAYFNSAIALDDQVSDNFYWLSLSLADQHYSTSIFRLYSLIKRFLESAKQAVALKPESLLAHENLLDFYVSVPGVLGGSEKLAEKHARVIADIDTAAGHYAQGRIYFAQDDFEKAEQQVRLALSLDPDRIRYHFGLGLVLASRGKNEEAINAFSHIANLKPDGPVELVSQWQALDKIGRISAASGTHLSLGQAAIEAYLKRPIVNPKLSDSNWARIRLASIYRHQGKKAQTVELLNDLLASEPNRKLRNQISKELKQLR